MEVTRLAWLAGIIDGEGVIGFYQLSHKRRGATFQYHVRVINSDPDIITECDSVITEIIGHRVSHGRDLRKNRNHIYWYISVNHQTDIVKLLDTILPYMIGKKKQAYLLLEMLKKHVRGARYTKIEREVIGILKTMKREKMTPTSGNAEPSRIPSGYRKCVENIRATTQIPMIIDLS